MRKNKLKVDFKKYLPDSIAKRDFMPFKPFVSGAYASCFTCKKYCCPKNKNTDNLVG